jgi:hypothetical protein
MIFWMITTLAASQNPFKKHNLELSLVGRLNHHHPLGWQVEFFLQKHFATPIAKISPPKENTAVPWRLINPVPWPTPTITHCNNALAANYTPCLDALY